METLFNWEALANLITLYAPKVVGAILTLFIGFWVANRVTTVVQKNMHRTGMDISVQPFLTSLVSVGLKVLVLLSVASMFGIETTSFVAIFGALAFAVGMALQGSLGHFASGVLILTFRPYKVGDLVDLNGNVGTVKEIQIFNTILVTLDNRKIIIPNGVATSSVITNISGQGTIGVDMVYSISYREDIDKARAVLQQVAKSCPHIIEEPSTLIAVKDYGPGAVNFLVRPWCKSEHYWDVYFYMYEFVKKEFDKAGVKMPLPPMDVHFAPNGSAATVAIPNLTTRPEAG